MECRKMTKMEIIKYLNDSMNSEFKEEREIAVMLLKKSDEFTVCQIWQTVKC